MIGISIANSKEWECTLNFFNKNVYDCLKYPYGEYFILEYLNKKIVVYHSGVRKVSSSSACQYMIDKFNLEKVIVIGTCAGVNSKYHELDIIIPKMMVQYDCTVKEMEPLIKERFNVSLDLKELDFNYHTGIIGTSDKPLVMYDDYLSVKENNIDIVDTESAAIAYVCKVNNVKILIIKGISDFPIKENNSDIKSSYDNQYNIFVSNIPKVMNKIFKEYLDKVL